jgi:hypothetical protein
MIKKKKHSVVEYYSNGMTLISRCLARNQQVVGGRQIYPKALGSRDPGNPISTTLALLISRSFKKESTKSESSVSRLAGSCNECA